MLRDLLRNFRRSGHPSDASALAADDVWASVGQAPRPGSEVLARIERAALEVYAAHGLPTRPGHYRWNPRTRTWTFLGEHLTPEARWEMLLERPAEAGWRYGTLSDLGRTGDVDVVAAAAVLDNCTRLRTRPPTREGAGPWEEMELAIQLGAQWQALESRRLKISEPRLRLTAPDAALRADGTPKPSRRKPARKP
ncbi:hypothetical protein BZG35_03790 [Brevundimonas sp. LM2]|uniref:hypothetical protein n=1 Tax=Brevundimonas sp. LM2 TaxID=1938605 RepID=UPI000983F99F|nr:hypothetical protein [Brevundimonas sp. LM2]AQR60870.1 hypothetical protein BZG35_03790 [Brevundimonas sp. LM2]